MATELPDRIISDYMTPILDGASMLLEMRKIETQRDIPCIIMSSMPEQNVRERVSRTLPLSFVSRSNLLR